MKAEKQKRMLWAKKTWILKKCQNILWSDEFKFERFGSKRSEYVTRKPGERLNLNVWFQKG